MLICKMYFLLLIFCTTTFAYSEGNVKYAAIIFRHGDRTPVDLYPNDPYKNESYWPVKFGELTNNGKRQHFNFGKWLRQRYSHLLSKDFDPAEIYIQSTDVDRTLMSAQANLAGLYPPSGKTIWNSDVMWQPIPVHTIPKNEDEVLSMEKPCSAYDRELENFTNSKAFIEGLSKYKKLMDYLTIHSGKKVKTYYDIESIYNTLYVESLYNFTLPNWTDAVYPNKMRKPACHSFTTDTGTPLLARLKVGPLLKSITNNMMSAITSDSGKHFKVHMYSAHDLTVGSILNGLGLFDGKCPCYTSAVFFELLSDTTGTSHYVKISYRNTTGIGEPYVLEIPDCGKICPINMFMKIYDNLISVDWERECTKEFTPRLAVAFLAGICVVVSIYIAHKIHFIRVYKNNRKVRGYANIMRAELQVTQLKTYDV